MKGKESRKSHDRIYQISQDSKWIEKIALQLDICSIILGDEAIKNKLLQEKQLPDFLCTRPDKLHTAPVQSHNCIHPTQGRELLLIQLKGTCTFWSLTQKLPFWPVLALKPMKVQQYVIDNGCAVNTCKFVHIHSFIGFISNNLKLKLIIFHEKDYEIRQSNYLWFSVS